MPGSVEAARGTTVRGWARHPRQADYAMTVHALVRGRLVASAVASLAREGTRDGFEVYLPRTANWADVQVVLGETDEYLDVPHVPMPARVLSVEDLIAAGTRRPWVTGATELDAERAGLLPETILDLLCRDYLNKPANPELLSTLLAMLQAGEGYDAVRRRLMLMPMHRDLRIYADRLPGAIFSQKMVMAAAAGDFSDSL